MGPRVPEVVVYSDWRPSGGQESAGKNAVVAAAESDSVRGKKRKLAEAESVRFNGSVGVRAAPVAGIAPVGLVWDSRDYSCAYDATFTILANLWTDNPVRWSTLFTQIGECMGQFGRGLHEVMAGSISLERVRDIIRRQMHSSRPEHFPFGPNGTSIDRVAMAVLPAKYYGTGVHLCPICGHTDGREYGVLEMFSVAGLAANTEYPNGVSLQRWMYDYLAKGRARCELCRIRGGTSRMIMRTSINSLPPILVLDITHEKLIFDRELIFDVNGVQARMRLRGIIYGGQGHFTCRFVDRSGGLWFHDGITTGRRCLQEVNLSAITRLLDLQRCGEKTAVAVIYARDL
ncbi:hypothetical protein C8R46DRAFT_905054 [Mycena filopes]|nr:hypothetical protein C8R46DRAFT_905054 [Mycena filopes]